MSQKRITAADLEFRWAQPDDAPALAALVDTGALPVDWAHPLATRGWLVADHKGSLLGACQVLIGHPIGQIERLHVVDGLEPREAHAVMLGLCRVGLVCLREVGSQVVTVFCEFANKGFKRILKKRFGGAATQQGNLMVASLIGEM